MAATAALPTSEGEGAPRPGPLDPQGRIHIPIGIANTVDTLKTFVEADGCFSPGVASYGVYFWLHDPQAGNLAAATMPGVACEHGLAEGGWLIPWSAWSAGDVRVRSEVCQVLLPVGGAEAHVVAARVQLANAGKSDKQVRLYAALRGLGPAGGPVGRLAVAKEGDALVADGHVALVSAQAVSAAGVAAADTIGEAAARGEVPAEREAASPTGDCSGALRLDVTLPAGASRSFGFLCPVLPGRRAVGHQWDGVSAWAQLDLAKPDPPDGGQLQPDVSLDDCRKLKADDLFARAAAYWKDLVGRSAVKLPDPRWQEALAAIAAHAALSMNEGAPDVAVVNYNVFNRDGVYIANILQKSSRLDLSEAAIDYFLAHPFNGRVYPEADNPGQVLWVMGQHWLFSRDTGWLARVYGGARKIAAMIRYYRTTPQPHWVCPDSLEFGDAIPAGKKRQKLEPGRCDGHHGEYTQAFDVAGLRAAAILAEAAGNRDDQAAWRKLADRLMGEYDAAFGGRLAKDYGSYCVLWPCRLYGLGEGKGHDAFARTGAQKPTGWRYFPLATAHQGLLAGSRQAGWGTVEQHLRHPQMRGWYAFDEGGKSGAGGWGHVRTTWPSGVAMPHGWAVAELHLLIRDCLAYEDDDRLVLLAGAPAEWFTAGAGLAVESLPTQFGAVSLRYERQEGGAKLTLACEPGPAGGFDLRLPDLPGCKVIAADKPVDRSPAGGYVLPAGTKQARIDFPPTR